MGRPGGRRVCFFAYYYPPLGGAGSLRALSFARHLPALGWEVTVVTPREGVYGRDPSLVGENLPGVQIIQVDVISPARWARAGSPDGAETRGTGAYVDEVRLGWMGNVLRTLVRRHLYFPDHARGWIRPAVRAAREEHRRKPFDLVLSSSPPVSAHLAARELSRKAKIPWVADWRDLWTPRLSSGPGVATRARALEFELLRAADGHLAATDGFAHWIGSRSKGRPVRTVRNGWEPSDFAAEVPESHRGVVVHTGTVYGADQDLSVFFRALSGSKGRGCVVRFLGKVLEETRAVAAKCELGPRVEFRGFTDHETALRESRWASGLLLLGWSGRHEDAPGIVPAKTYEYLATGRPILALARPRSELERLLSGVVGVTVCDFHDEVTMTRWLEDAGGGSFGPGPSPDSALPFTRRRAAEIVDGALREALAESRR